MVAVWGTPELRAAAACCAPFGFETSEPLDRLADRLRAVGFAPTMIPDGPDPRIVLIDPDGDEVQIHPAP